MALGQWLAYRVAQGQGYPVPTLSPRKKGVSPLSLGEGVRVRAILT